MNRLDMNNSRIKKEDNIKRAERLWRIISMKSQNRQGPHFSMTTLFRIVPVATVLFRPTDCCLFYHQLRLFLKKTFAQNKIQEKQGTKKTKDKRKRR
jgi:hypothetical protein